MTGRIHIRRYGSQWFATCDVCRLAAPRPNGWPVEGGWHMSGARAIRAAAQHVDVHYEQFPWLGLFGGHRDPDRRIADLERENARLRRRLAERQAERAAA